MRSLIVLFAVALLGVDSASVALPCVEGQAANFDSVKVVIGDTECTTTPCNLVRGQAASGYITFTAKKEITEITQKAKAKVLSLGGITTPYPIKDASLGCDRLQDGSYCPLAEGEVATNLLSVPVPNDVPAASLLLTLWIEDQDGEEIACFSVYGDVA